MEFKFEYNKNYLPEDYLKNRDVFIKAMNKKCSIGNMDALIKYGLVDNFSVDENGFVVINSNEEKIEKLVKDWKS